MTPRFSRSRKDAFAGSCSKAELYRSSALHPTPLHDKSSIKTKAIGEFNFFEAASCKDQDVSSIKTQAIGLHNFFRQRHLKDQGILVGRGVPKASGRTSHIEQASKQEISSKGCHRFSPILEIKLVSLTIEHS